ncbi:MAG: hypothetical protein IT381_21210 [Deltaproteobacteria bacterium]|nr:hypothetical protein [Deltaproteobacteria bacterium]
MEPNDVPMVEWAAWRAICEQLEALGAVTESDLKSSAGASGTPGLDLIHAIKAWGKAYVKLNDYQGEKDRG